MSTSGQHSVIILTGVITDALRSMLHGIIRYSQEHGPWRLYQYEDRRWSYNFKNWEKWGADAIIAADHHSVSAARRIAAAGLPTIVLLQPHEMHSRHYPLHDYPCCLFDSRAIGELAAHYFIEHGYLNYAFVDDIKVKSYWSVDREQAFRQTLQAFFGKNSDWTYCRYGGARLREQMDWMIERPRMTKWLQKLPKPCAVFAPNDRRGKQVLDACTEGGIQVPDELAILGCDNSPWICESSVPTLSSIRCDVETAGYKIAAELEAIMDGRHKCVRREIPVKPLEIVTRQSTNWFAVRDKKVANTLQRIQQLHGNPELNVGQLARAAGIARRTLELRFRKATGQTIFEEIERVRLAHAQMLLLEGNKFFADLSRLCGYASPSYFSRAFRKRFNLSPSEWIRLHGPKENRST